MPDAGQHAVNRLIMDFSLEAGADYTDFQHRFSEACRLVLIPALEELFDRYGQADLHWVFDRIEIDAGFLRPDHLAEDLVQEVIRQLEEILQDVAAGQESHGAEVLPAAVSDLTLFAEYLETGALSWPAPPDLNPDQLTLRVTGASPAESAGLVRRLGQMARVRRRIAWQLADPSVRAVVRSLSPADFPFIADYADDLAELHQRRKLIEAGEKEFRKANWEFILHFLLVERHTDFEAIQLARSSLQQMAARYNLSYGEVLHFLGSVIAAESQSLVQRTNLPQLLALLQREYYAESGAAPPADSLLWLLGGNEGIPVSRAEAEVPQREPQWKQRLDEIAEAKSGALPPGAREPFVIHLLDWKRDEVLAYFRESLRDEQRMRRLFLNLSESLVKEIVYRLGGSSPWALQWIENWMQWLRSPESPHADQPGLRREALLQLAIGVFHPANTVNAQREWETLASEKEVFRSYVMRKGAEEMKATGGSLPLWLNLLEAFLKGKPLPPQMSESELAQQFTRWAFEQAQAAREWIASLETRGVSLEVWAQKMPLAAVRLAVRLIYSDAFPLLRLTEGRMLTALRGIPLSATESIRRWFWQWVLQHAAVLSGLSGEREVQWRTALASELPAWLRAAGLPAVEDWEMKLSATAAVTDEPGGPFDWKELPEGWQAPGFILEWMQSADERQRAAAHRSLASSGLDGAAAQRLLSEGAESVEWLVRWMSGSEWKVVETEVNAWLHYLLHSAVREGTEVEVRLRLWRAVARNLSEWRPGPYDSTGFLHALRRQIAGAFQLAPDESVFAKAETITELPSPPDAYQQQLIAALKEGSTSGAEAVKQTEQALQFLLAFYPHRVRMLVKGLPQASLQQLMRLAPVETRPALVAALQPEQAPAVMAFLRIAREAQERLRLAAGSTEAFEAQVFLFALIYISRPGAGAFSAAAFLEAMMWQLAAFTGRSTEEVTAAFASETAVQAPGGELAALVQYLVQAVGETDEENPTVPEELLSADTRAQWLNQAAESERVTALQLLAPQLHDTVQEFMLNLLRMAEAAGLAPAALARLREVLWLRLFTSLLTEPGVAQQPRPLWMELLKLAMEPLAETEDAGTWLERAAHSGLSTPARAALQSLLRDVQVVQWAAERRRQRESGESLRKKVEGAPSVAALLLQYLQEGSLAGSLTTGMMRQLLSQQLSSAPQALLNWLRREPAGSAAWRRFLSLLQGAELRALLLQLQSAMAPLWLDVLDVFESAALRLSFGAGHSPQGFREEVQAFVLTHSARESGLAWLSTLPQLITDLAAQAGASAMHLARTVNETLEVMRPVLRSGGTTALLSPVLTELAALAPAGSGAGAEKKQTFDYDQWEGPEDWPFRKKKQGGEGEEGDASWLVPNAGIVLVWPYLRTLFERAGTMNAGQFHDETAQWRSVYLLRYLTHLDKETHEPDLILNKVLCGLPVGEPPPGVFEMTEAEKTLCANMLTGVIGNWPILGTVPNDTLREGFLVREGVLRKEEANWQLKVEQKAYDVLMTELPWGIGTVSLSWMKELILVEWWK